MRNLGRLAPRLSIRTKLTFLIGSAASFAVVCLTTIYVFSALQQTEDNVHATNLQTARLVGALAESFVANTAEELQVLASDPYLLDRQSAGDVAGMANWLRAIAGHDSDLTDIVVLDSAGVIRAGSSNGDSVLLGSDLSGQDQVQTVLTGAPVGIGLARAGVISGKPSVPLAAPLLDVDRKLIGVLQAGLSLERLSAYMDRVPVGQAGYVSLLTRDGMILTNPDRKRILTPAVGANQAVIEAKAGRSAAVTTINRTGVSIFAAAIPVPSLGWIVQVQMPRDEALVLFYRNLTQGAAAGFGTLLISVLLSSLGARYASAAIRPLRDASERWARGDFAFQVTATATD
ncbi:MAG: cache domain-containing protein, partial [Chloroflexi bacterium]|nr:cache domain-containing protein [Chloroflexota bacterium]